MRDFFGKNIVDDGNIDFEASKSKKETVHLNSTVITPIIAKNVNELRTKIRATFGNDDMDAVQKYVNAEIEKEKEDETKKILEKITGAKVDENTFELEGEASKILHNITHPIESEKLKLDAETKKLEQKMMGNTVQYMEKARRKKAVKELIKELQEEE